MEIRKLQLNKSNILFNIMTMKNGVKWSMSEYKRVWNLVKILKNSIDIYLHMLYNMYCKEGVI